MSEREMPSQCKLVRWKPEKLRFIRTIALPQSRPIRMGMFVYRIFRSNARGTHAFREDMPVETDAADAIARAEAAATDCTVELWRGSNLLATFRPKAVRPPS